MQITNPLIYLDHASTSYPKPAPVLHNIQDYIYNIGVNPHRSIGYRGQKAEKVIADTRAILAELLNVDDPNQISFTHNATHALNILIKGILKEEDHVILSNFEHNAVLRPLYKLKKERNISFDIIESDKEGLFDLAKIEQKINSKTRLIIWNHASNVLGVVSPLEEIGKLAEKHNLLLLVDCAQTAGIIDINVKRCKIDFLACTAHKSLLGPPGVGFLYARDCALVDTLMEGGSGHNSASPLQPDAAPYKFEAGTLNYLGIAGLYGALEYVEKHEEEIKYQEYALLRFLINRLQEIEEVTIYGTLDISKKVPLVSFNLRGLFPQELSSFLDKEFSILVRAGLHCAPNIHKTLGTFPTGTVRVSLGYSNTKEDVQTLVDALQYALRSSQSYSKKSVKPLLAIAGE